MGIVFIHWSKSFRKFFERKFVILVFIVPLEKLNDLFSGREHANSVKSFLQASVSQLPLEYLVRICQIKIYFLH